MEICILNTILLVHESMGLLIKYTQICDNTGRVILNNL